MVASHTGESDSDLLKWSFYKFYTKVSYISHINRYQKRLQELVTRR